MSNSHRLAENTIRSAIVARFAGQPGVFLEVNETGYNRRTHHHYGLGGKAGKGGADIIGAVRGRATAIEVKDPHAPPSRKADPDQVAWRARWEAAGGVYAVVTSVAEAEVVVGTIILEVQHG